MSNYYNDPYYDPYSGWDLFPDLSHQTLLEYLFSDMTVGKMVMYIIAGFVIFLTLMSIAVNLWDWLVNVYRYNRMGWFQLKYPDFAEKIIKFKFEIYIVGIPSGEVFYVERKKLKKLKRKGLITWNCGAACYTFDDEHSERVIKIISPIIIFKYKNNVNRVEFDAT